MKKSIWVFLFQKYGKFWSFPQDNFIKHNPLISEEWVPSVAWKAKKHNRKKKTNQQHLKKAEQTNSNNRWFWPWRTLTWRFNNYSFTTQNASYLSQVGIRLVYTTGCFRKIFIEICGQDRWCCLKTRYRIPGLHHKTLARFIRSAVKVTKCLKKCYYSYLDSIFKNTIYAWNCLKWNDWRK